MADPTQRPSVLLWPDRNDLGRSGQALWRRSCTTFLPGRNQTLPAEQHAIGQHFITHDTLRTFIASAKAAEAPLAASPEAFERLATTFNGNPKQVRPSERPTDSRAADIAPDARSSNTGVATPCGGRAVHAAR
jgi:hypothetical protein